VLEYSTVRYFSGVVNGDVFHRVLNRHGRVLIFQRIRYRVHLIKFIFINSYLLYDCFKKISRSSYSYLQNYAAVYC
jgi:hypothetical protein